MTDQARPHQKTPQQLADELFEATAQQRIFDAIHKGRDSDVHYGICSALATVGLIDHARFRALEFQISEHCESFYSATQPSQEQPHAD